MGRGAAPGVGRTGFRSGGGVSLGAGSVHQVGTGRRDRAGAIAEHAAAPLAAAAAPAATLGAAPVVADAQAMRAGHDEVHRRRGGLRPRFLRKAVGRAGGGGGGSGRVVRVWPGRLGLLGR